jgi:hypothetical protein
MAAESGSVDLGENDEDRHAFWNPAMTGGGCSE